MIFGDKTGGGNSCVSNQKMFEVHMTEITTLHRLNYSVPVTRGYAYVHTVSIPVDALPNSIDTT